MVTVATEQVCKQVPWLTVLQQPLRSITFPREDHASHCVLQQVCSIPCVSGSHVLGFFCALSPRRDVLSARDSDDLEWPPRLRFAHA